MFNRKIITFLMIMIFIGVSVFGQNVAAVKQFERARRTIPVSISLNIFGFGIGSFVQGDYKSAFIQLGVSTVGYALLFSGILGNFSKTETRYDNGYRYTNKIQDDGPKNTLIGIGSALLVSNMVFGTIRPTLYQFDKKFDDFYDINNDVKWPGGF